MARVLVIGGTLFIGRALVEQLLQRRDEVTVMHRGSGTPYDNKVSEIRCDRNDVAAVRAALSGRKFDVVYDNVYDWKRGTSADQVSAAAMALPISLRRYVFTSSVAVYPPGGDYDEDAPLVPSDSPNAYGRQKAESERLLFKLQQRSGIPVTTIRPAFIYGPHNPFEREAFFWDRVLAGRPIIVPDDGMRTMQWVHVHDVARAAVLAANADAAVGKAYNLASYPAITQNAFVELLAKVANRKVDLVHVSREQIERRGGSVFAPPYYFGAYLDIPPITARPDRARSDLGLELTPLEEGFRQTYRWYRSQPRPEPDFSWEDRLLASAH